MAKPITLQPAKAHTLCFDVRPTVSTALYELRALRACLKTSPLARDLG
jgi:hypothetical protein